MKRLNLCRIIQLHMTTKTSHLRSDHVLPQIYAIHFDSYSLKSIQSFSSPLKPFKHVNKHKLKPFNWHEP